MGSSSQEYWSGLPFPPPGDLPHSGIEPTSLVSPALVGGFFTAEPTWEGCRRCSVSLCCVNSRGRASPQESRIFLLFSPPPGRVAEGRPPALDEKQAGGCRGGDGRRGEGLRTAAPLPTRHSWFRPKWHSQHPHVSMTWGHILLGQSPKEA